MKYEHHLTLMLNKQTEIAALKAEKDELIDVGISMMNLLNDVQEMDKAVAYPNGAELRDSFCNQFFEILKRNGWSEK